MSKDIFNQALDRIYGEGKPQRTLDDCGEANYYLIKCEAKLKRLRAAMIEAIALIDDPDIPSVSKAYVARERLAREVEGE